MTNVDLVLEGLYQLGQMFPRPFETKYAWNSRLRKIGWPQYNRAVRQLGDRGFLAVIQRQGKRFLKLTNKGQLEALLLKAKQSQDLRWDGRWRLIIFDIPENQKEKRHLFRVLLKRNGFYKLQASVYINPYPLNTEALIYLKQTGLIEFIRILRVDMMDEDKKLKKYFGLK